jgi:uncharacterized protein YllA (UPF0747 family)
MNLNSFANLDFRKLNALVRDYCGNNDGLRGFFEIGPTIQAMVDFANNRLFSSQKFAVLHEALTDQYAKMVSVPQVNDNIHAFSEGNVVCVTTGHQLCLLGGACLFLLQDY